MTAQADREPTARLPTLWAGERRRHLSLLVLFGLGQAAAAGLGALLLSHALRGTGGMSPSLVVLLMVVAALVIGLLRMVERIVAEQLSQHYVHEVRLGLIRHNLSGAPVRSLGIAVARTTNDLTSVKNWVSQGVAPLAIGIPLLVGAGLVLAWLAPLLAVALLVPVVILLATMGRLAPVAYSRSRDLRRRRGRLSSHVADTMLSTTAIRSAGGSERELRRTAKFSDSLVVAAIDRAKIAGALRGAAAATSGVATALVVGVGLLAGLPTHTIAAALAIVGFLASPIHDLGRVAEYRQTYRAARRIIAPAILPADSAPSTRRPVIQGPVSSRPVSSASEGPAEGDVVVRGLELGDGSWMPGFRAAPGDRIIVDLPDPTATNHLLERFVGLQSPHPGEIVVDGTDLADVDPKLLRSIVGYAAHGMMLVRGSVGRNARYRCPDAEPEDVERLMSRVGLADRLDALPDGLETSLVHGGEPLTRSERARLLVARALLDEPPLVVFDNIDADLGSDGRELLRELLADYPGVVLLASDEPERVVIPSRFWSLESATSLREAAAS